MTDHFPQEFRHLADQRDSRTSPKSRRKASHWALDIAGPFCFYPPRKGEARQLADILSALLCLPVRHRVADGAVYITIAGETSRGAGA